MLRRMISLSDLFLWCMKNRLNINLIFFLHSHERGGRDIEQGEHANTRRGRGTPHSGRYNRKKSFDGIVLPVPKTLPQIQMKFSIIIGSSFYYQGFIFYYYRLNFLLSQVKLSIIRGSIFYYYRLNFHLFFSLLYMLNLRVLVAKLAKYPYHSRTTKAKNVQLKLYKFAFSFSYQMYNFRCIDIYY